MRTELPRVIWMLWLQGWADAPPIVQACRARWESTHPGWEVRALTSATIGDHVDLAGAYPRVDLERLPPAARSDLVRLALLREHGGVWTDATVFPMRPLEGWLPLDSGFFAFDRPRPSRLLSSWFLAATPGHPVIVRWQDLSQRYWCQRSVAHRYHWVHDLFAQAYAEDPLVRAAWDATPRISAEGSHLFGPADPRLLRPMTAATRARLESGADPVYKLNHRASAWLAARGSGYEWFTGQRGSSRPVVARRRLLRRLRRQLRRRRALTGA